MKTTIQKPLPESLAAALKRKETLLISLGSKWRQRTTNRSLGIENKEADVELDRLAFEFGEDGEAFPSSGPATSATPKSRAEVKAALWLKHSQLSPTEKQPFYLRHQREMD